MVVAWLTTLAVLTCIIALFFFVISGGTLVLRGRLGRHGASARGLAIAWAFLLLVFAARAYLGRFERIFQPHSIFTGVTYTDAHVILTGLLVVSLALVGGALVAAAAAARAQASDGW